MGAARRHRAMYRRPSPDGRSLPGTSLSGTPTRRTVLAGAGAAVAGSLAGCTGLLGGGPPDWAAWLADPEAVVPSDRHAFASVDLGAVRADADRLPGAVRSGLDDLDREFRSVDLAAVDRLSGLTVGRATRGRLAASVVAAGEFDPEAVRREVTAGSVEQVDRVGEFRLYAYAPSLLADLERFRTPDGATPDLSFGLAVSDAVLVAGAALATASADVSGLAAVRASIDAHAEAAPRYAAERRDVRDVLATLGGDALVAGVSPAVVDALRERLPPERDALRTLLGDVRSLGAAASLADERISVALVGDPSDLLSPDRIRSAIDDDDSDVEVERVRLARDGRVVRADVAADADRLEEVAGNVPLSPTDAVNWLLADEGESADGTDDSAGGEDDSAGGEDESTSGQNESAGGRLHRPDAGP